jgi:hypothetical protein
MYRVGSICSWLVDTERHLACQQSNAGHRLDHLHCMRKVLTSLSHGRQTVRRSTQSIVLSDACQYSTLLSISAEKHRNYAERNYSYTAHYSSNATDKMEAHSRICCIVCVNIDTVHTYIGSQFVFTRRHEQSP